MEIKCKQLWSTIQSISIKQTVFSSKHLKISTYVDGKKFVDSYIIGDFYVRCYYICIYTNVVYLSSNLK